MEDTDSSVLLTPKHRQKWHYHLENVATYKLEFHLFKKQNSLIINGFFFNSLVFTSNILSLSREKESLLCSIVSSTPKWKSLCPVKELSLLLLWFSPPFVAVFAISCKGLEPTLQCLSCCWQSRSMILRSSLKLVRILSFFAPKCLDLKVRVLVLDGFLLMTIEHWCFITRWAFSSGSSFSQANLALRWIIGKPWFFVFQFVLMLLLSLMWFWYFGACKFSLRFLFFPNIYHCCIFFYLYFDFSNKIYTV